MKYVKNIFLFVQCNPLSAVKTSISCPFKKLHFSYLKKLILQNMTMNITMFCDGTDSFHVGYALELIFYIQNIFTQKCNLFMHQRIKLLQYQIPWMPNICSISTKYTLIYIFLLTRGKWYIWCLCFWRFCTTNYKKDKKDLC